MRAIVNLRLALVGLLLLGLCACDAAVSESGLRQPFRTQGGQFMDESPRDAVEGGPLITSLETLTGRVRHGMRGKFLAGRTAPEAFSVAVWLEEVMDGYWVVPAGAPSPADNNERSFNMLLDFSGDLPAGRYGLRIAAIDEEGRRGPSRRLSLCVAPPWPDNANACDATQRPPLAVVSLEWNTDADVDLIVLGPDGRVFGGRTRNSAVPPAGTSPNTWPADIARVDVNAGAGCRRDGLRRENLIFPERPPAGEYRVHARLTSPCGSTSTTVRATTLQRVEARDGEYALQRLREDITYLPLESSDPDGPGTFLLSLTF